MSNELTINGSIAYADSEGAEELLDITNLLASVASKKYIKLKMNVGITEEAVFLGECTSPGWAIFVNRDETNFIELRVSTGGAKSAKMKPGEPAILRLGSGSQAPYVIADTAPCQMEYFIAQT